ncbi:UNVERIFIED_CONTAM: hypothetical protein RMT77_014665 [Armadillidium vulgare]
MQRKYLKIFSTGKPLDGVGEAILVLSEKCGVGKSTITVQIASSIKMLGHKVGILDLDLCGPSIPVMVGVEGCDVLTNPDGKWIPVSVNNDKNFSVISLAFFIDSKNDEVICGGPKKNSMFKQLLTNIAWDVDYLVINTPPGTSDEQISVMENIRDCPVKGAVLVTIPQMVAVDDFTRGLIFCRRNGIKVLGIIENMSGFECSNCSDCSNIFATGRGQKLAEKFGVPFLGKAPIYPSLTK